MKNGNGKKELSHQLLRRLEFEKLISEVSTYLASLHAYEFEKVVKFILKKVVHFMKVERGLFFLFTNDHKHFSSCNEWKKTGISSVLNVTQNLSTKDFCWFWKKIKNQDILKIDGINNLPKNVHHEKVIWKGAGIKSLIVVRLTYRDEILGFLSFSSLHSFREWKEEDSILLITIAQALARAYVRKLIFCELENSKKKLENALLQTINVLSKTVETRDPYTYHHQFETGVLAVAIAQEMGLSPEQIRGIELGSLLHDIGKIYIPAEILNRPGKLTELEMTIIRTHPLTGYRLLKNVTFPWPIANIALQHHERLNGSGYPNHLKAKDIPIEVRIVSVADVVEAMSSHRPYRPAHSLKEALREITKNKKRLYDEKVVNACLRVFKKGFKFKSRNHT